MKNKKIGGLGDLIKRSTIANIELRKINNFEEQRDFSNLEKKNSNIDIIKEIENFIKLEKKFPNTDKLSYIDIEEINIDDYYYDQIKLNDDQKKIVEILNNNFIELELIDDNNFKFKNDKINNLISDIFDIYDKSNNGIIKIEELDKSKREGGSKRKKNFKGLYKGGNGLCYMQDLNNDNCDKTGVIISELNVINEIDLQKVFEELKIFRNNFIKGNNEILNDDNSFLCKYLYSVDTKTSYNSKFMEIYSNIMLQAFNYELEKADSNDFAFLSDDPQPFNIKLANIQKVLNNSYGGQLFKYIDIYKNYINNKFEIDYSPKYNYNNCIHEIDSNQNKIVIDYSYHYYNYNIVNAFQDEYIKNRENFLNLIKEQKEYVKNLSLTKKRIIQDYTKHYCFGFYNRYKGFIRSSKTDDQKKEFFQNEEKNFGDSFYATIYLICKLYEKNTVIYNKYKQIYTKVKDFHGDIGDKNFISWLLNDRIEPNADFILNKCEFDYNDWENILEAFIYNINYIVKDAPKNKEVIHCYRGASFHYIKDYSSNAIMNIKNKKKLKFFTSDRLSSYSLSFDVSYHYHNFGDNPETKCMYKTAIMPECSILYVAPLSFASEEFEIISPTNSIFLYDIDNTNKIIRKTCYNNIHRKCGIFPNYKKGFNTYNNILFSTPIKQNIEIELMKNDIFKNIIIPHDDIDIFKYYKEKIKQHQNDDDFLSKIKSINENEKIKNKEAFENNLISIVNTVKTIQTTHIKQQGAQTTTRKEPIKTRFIAL